MLAYLFRSLSDIGSVGVVVLDLVPVAATGELNFDDFDFTKLFELFEIRTVHIVEDVVPPAIALSLVIVLVVEELFTGFRPDASAHAFRITLVFSSDFSLSMRVLLKDRLPRLMLLFTEIVAFDEVVDDSDEDVSEFDKVVRVGGDDVVFNSKFMVVLPFRRSSAAAAAAVGLFSSDRRVRRPLFELIVLFAASVVAAAVLVLSVLDAIAAVVVCVQCSSLAPLLGVMI